MKNQADSHKTLSNLKVKCVISFFICQWGKDVLRTCNFNDGTDALYFVIDNNMKIKSIVTTEEKTTIYTEFK